VIELNHQGERPLRSKFTSAPIGLGYIVTCVGALIMLLPAAATALFQLGHALSVIARFDGASWVATSVQAGWVGALVALAGVLVLVLFSLIPAFGSSPPWEYNSVLHTIDVVVEKLTFVFATVLLPLVLANAVEVVWRYTLQDPTIWALDVTTMSFGAFFMLGCAYALQKGAHVRTDMLWDKFSERKKGVIDSIAFVFFFIPAMLILLWIGWGSFLDAYNINEKSNSGAWQPIIWPLRATVPLTFALLLLQGISELMKSLWAARTGQVLVKHEKIEV
jgi:TRAP-type mannitol/chloroaromatic compound transport system permease small subunit